MYEDRPRKEYAIVVDARMLESTVFLYEYVRTGNRSARIRVPYNESISPGLLFFYSDPDEGVGMLKHLVYSATAPIPFEEIQKTPITVLATGIRTLPSDKVKVLLMAFLDFLKTTGLKVNDKSVSPMSGRTKFYSWVAVNVLLGRFEDPKLKTASAIDLGIGSLHEAFAPEKSVRLAKWQRELLTNWTLYGTEYKVFGYSCYGLGLYQGRMQIIEKSRVNDTNLYVSPCVHPSVNAMWEYYGKVYDVQGSKGNGTLKEVNLTECSRLVRSIVSLYTSGPSLQGTEVYASSYFYDVAVESGFVRRGDNVNITLKDIRTRTKVVCKVRDPSRPFLCMDLTFMKVLMKRQYHLRENSQINLAVKLKNLDLRWTVGAGFYLWLQYRTLEDY